MEGEVIAVGPRASERPTGLSSSETSSTSSEPIVVQRTPHMDLIGETPLAPGDRFSVRVFVDTEPPRTGEDSEELRVTVPGSTQILRVDVRIAATDHFILPDLRIKLLDIPIASDAAVVEVRYDIAVRPDVIDLADARLWAYFSYQGRPSGQVTISVPLRRRTERQLPAVTTRSDSGAVRGASIRIQSKARLPDLLIDITNPRGNLLNLECEIHSPHLNLNPPESHCEWHLPATTKDLVAAHFAEFVDPNLPSLNRFHSLRGAGDELWNVAPGIVKDAIWRLIDTSKLRTILVVSADPFIPWELMIPSRSEGEIKSLDKPLGAKFAVGRWISIDHLSPPQETQLTRSLVIAPNYRGPRPKALAHAPAEAKAVCDRVPGEILVPAQYKKVTGSLFCSQVNLVHFACHGVANSAPGIQRIYLEDFPFSSAQLAGLPRPAKMDKPFVFLNACEVGRPVPSLNGVGGFAPVFIRLGATGVIAPLWSVKDHAAHEVALSFYRALGTNSTVSYAEIVRDIRARAYADTEANFEDTYAAYCFYGDPLATVVRVSK